MSKVAFERVTKRFGSIVAVDNLTLEVHDREFLVLLGPSGCGKSTVLRMIAGLEEPDEGTIRIGDRVVNDVEPKDRDVAMVFQSYALYPHMTVRRNIEFPLRARNVSPAERRSAVDAAVRMLDLEDLLERKPAQLSGGQRQRVALARAIVRRPAAFLMDEPLSNLDATLRVQTHGELIDLQRRFSATVVYVTHDQVEAMTMGHRIGVLEHGVLQQLDEPQNVYRSPANLFVARFIGTPPMNTVEGDLDGSGGDVAFRAGSSNVRLPATLARAVESRRLERVVLGVRPEHLHVVSHGRGPGGTGTGGTLEGTVAVVESLGHERHVVCRLDDGHLVIARQSGDAAIPNDGQPIHLESEPEHLHLFDAVTGQRVDV